MYLELDLKFFENWRSKISGKVFYDFAYAFKGRENFSQEVLDELEKESEFRELYLQGSIFENFDIKLGKQIIVWGMANSLRVVDILNPIDNREFGMPSLEDTRIPINMTRLNYYFGDFKIEAVAIHEKIFNKSAPYGSDFYPVKQKVNEVIPENNSENLEYGLAFEGTFSGWDASLYWAEYFDDNAHYKISSIATFPGIVSVPIYEMHHSSLEMIGMVFGVSSGNYLWKTEAAKIDGMEFALVPEKTFSRLDLLFGIEYSGFSETLVSVESILQHLYDFDVRLKSFPDYEVEDNYLTSFSFEQTYLNQTFNFNLSGMMIGKRGEEGGINRATLDYKIFDDFSVKGGFMIYQPGERELFKRLNGNDRLFLEIRVAF